MNKTYTLRDGTVLELQAPSEEAIRNLLLGSELSAILSETDVLERADAIDVLRNTMDTKQLIGVSSATTRLFNYCVGWGVTTNPPEADLRELEALDFDVSTERVARVNWLCYIKIEDAKEAGNLMGEIMALAFEAEEQKRIVPKQEQIQAAEAAPTSELVEELMARIAELEARDDGRGEQVVAQAERDEKETGRFEP